MFGSIINKYFPEIKDNDLCELILNDDSLELLSEYPLIQPDICIKLSTYGAITILKYDHVKKYFLIESVCIKAAKNGHLECLRYAHENGCPWNERTCTFASANDSLKCPMYAHQNGCPETKNPLSKERANV